MDTWLGCNGSTPVTYDNMQYRKGQYIYNTGYGCISSATDQDGDSVADASDACPTQPGPALTGGCPDSDGDGTRDLDDRCPAIAGFANLWGCPDVDANGNGLADTQELLPWESDVNRDGRPDVVGFGGGGVQVALNTGASFKAATTWLEGNFGYNAGGWRVEQHPRMVSTAGITLSNLTAPSISGTRKVGYTLTANVGIWSHGGLTYKYQWFRGTAAISGATAKVYKLPASVRGQKVRVRVSAVRAGYTSLSKYSAYTTAIR